MHRSTLTFVSSLAIAGLTALTLTGCAPESPSASSSALPGEAQPQAEPDGKSEGEDTTSSSPSAIGEVKWSNSDVTYTAELQFCSLTAGGDALFHGLTFDSDGNEVGYLEGDFTNLGDSPHGEARIDFGATRKLQSMEDFIAMGSVGGAIVIADSSDTSLTVVGAAWDPNGTVLPTTTLKVTC